jgi:hypothetical protein
LLENGLDPGRVRERRLPDRRADPDHPVGDVPAGQLLLGLHAAHDVAPAAAVVRI